ncbi:MAG: sigma-70 family RNA polymerase sigma factor [Myxococcales bacterium FL481]|nr:MAG: sigma-70 family RNA polymerase sigma factor [Myxococcales bacterium FL481]
MHSFEPIVDLTFASFVFSSGCVAVAVLMSMCSILWSVRGMGTFLLRWGRAPRPEIPAKVVLPQGDRAHLSAGLSAFTEHTRHLVCDLWGVLAQARAWPQASGEPTTWRWWTRLLGGGDDDSYAPLSYVARETWLWVRAFESLDPNDRAHLEALGFDLARARELLAGDAPFAQRSGQLLKWLIDLDTRLHQPISDPYRGTVRRSAADLGGLTLCRAMETAAVEVANCPADSAEPTAERPDDEAYRQRFEAAMDEHRPAIAAMCRKYTRCPADAEDLLQDVTLEIWRALPRFREDCSLRTYMLRIARFRIIDHLRRRRAHLPEVAVRDPSTDPERFAEESERYASLRKAIRCLPTGLRDVMRLRLEDRSYGEIAQEVGITESNVSVRLTRARHALRRHLCGAT